jgi:hypothetical protein
MWLIWIGAKEEPLKGTTPSAAPNSHRPKRIYESNKQYENN